MTPRQKIVDETEAFLQRRAAELTQPRDGECLCCYLNRQLESFPCDNTLRHALHYRDVVAPRVTGLAASLKRMGGYCDCEVLMNGYGLAAGDEDVEVEIVPPCQGVHAGSVEPCRNWVSLRRW